MACQSKDIDKNSVAFENQKGSKRLLFRHTPKLSFWQKNTFFHQISKSPKIVQKWWENIPEKPQTLYFHKLIELCTHDKYFLKKMKKCILGSLIFTHHGSLFFVMFKWMIKYNASEGASCNVSSFWNFSIGSWFFWFPCRRFFWFPFCWLLRFCWLIWFYAHCLFGSS